MKKRVLVQFKKTICLIFSFCLLLCAVAPCLSVGGEAKISNDTLTVKAGFFAFDGYHMQDDSGTRSGYGYEILQHIAGYAGFKYEYVGYKCNWDEMQDMLANGEIDLLTSAQKTPQREELFDFSDSNIGVSAAILTVKAGDSSFVNSDYENWSGIRVGMIEGNTRNKGFDDFAREHGFTYLPVYFKDTEKMVTALKSEGPEKQIDAIITSNLRHIENEWIIAQFDSSPFYIMVKKGNTELLNRINYAINQLDLCEQGFRTMLMNRFYSPENGSAIAFTSEELKYIESMRGKSIKALISPDRAPYSWLEDGSFHGIFYDIAQMISERTGLNFEFIKTSDRTEYHRKIEENAATVRFDSDSSYTQAESERFWLTAPYITVLLTRLIREDTKEFNTVAMPLNYSVTDGFLKDLKSGLKIVYYDSVKEVVQAVMDGKQDFAYLAEGTAKLAVRDDVTNRLITEEVLGEEISYRIAVSCDESPLLYSILVKSVLSFDSGEIYNLRQQYAQSYEKAFSLIGFFYDYPLQTILLVVFILGVVLFIIVISTKAKHRKNELAHMQRDREQNILLKDALASAERAGTAKSQFLSRVSHEMRTPLNAIIGFLELAKTADEEQTAGYLASSDVAAKQLLSVINDVLDMSSIESGKMKIASAPFNFRHLVASVTNIYGTQCKQKGLSYETKLSTPVADWLVGDEMRVNQILMNLLGNSVKFTSSGHIWLEISETSSDEDRVFLRFTVSDTGCGMSEEMLLRLFKPFEQESATTARKYGGSGLGLSIVKNLSSMMGGTVRVESKLGEGTSFIVDLPFERSNIKQLISLPDKTQALRVLVVDDEKSERDYISTVLKRIGVRSSEVSGGSEALAELEKASSEGDAYSICLVDWKMPGMNGMSTTKQIRDKYGDDVIVIVVSAYDFQHTGESARKAGANMFLSKPLFQSSLFDLLSTITGGAIAEIKQEEPKIRDFAGKRVLLAEDNTLNQIVVMGYLAKSNIVVDLAENGKIAFEKFLASEPGFYDAILMDIQMPVMDGYEATQAIRKSSHPQAATIQIIAQSADAFNEDIAKSLSCGMNAHVAKPIKPDVLTKALYKAFSENKY